MEGSGVGLRAWGLGLGGGVEGLGAGRRRRALYGFASGFPLLAPPNSGLRTIQREPLRGCWRETEGGLLDLRVRRSGLEVGMAGRVAGRGCSEGTCN